MFIISLLLDPLLYIDLLLHIPYSCILLSVCTLLLESPLFYFSLLF